MSDIGSKGKVLILDDEEMVGEITCQMLNHLGYQATLVQEGESAISEYQRKLSDGEPYDLVIMDLVVPAGMGGREAVQEILAIDPAARVIAASGYSTDPVMTGYADYGFSGVLNKPYNMDILEASLKTMDNVSA